MKHLLFSVTGLFLLLNFNLKAAVFTAVKSGDWSSSSTWSNSGTPGSADTVMIPSPYAVTYSSGGKMSISTGGTLNIGSNSLTIDNGVKVEVNGMLISGSLQLNSTSSLINRGTITTGSLHLDNSTTFTNTGTVNASDLELNKTSVFTDNGSMTVNTSIAIDDNASLIIDAGKTLTDNGSYDDYSSQAQTDNGAVIVAGTATFYGGSSISGSGYLTGGEIQNYKNDMVWGLAKSYFPCFNCTIPHTIPLPITLISFSAIYNNDAVQLTWATASEAGSNYFTVSRSGDGVNFTTFTRVKGAGNSTEEKDYSYTDLTAPDGVNYYKLQQTDYDGVTTQDAIVAVTINESGKTARVMPNPVKNSCIVTFNDSEAEYFQLSIYDLMGRETIVQNIQSFKGSNAIELNTSGLADGIYIISLPVKNNPVKVKFIKH
jgi:hypothetical protein